MARAYKHRLGSGAFKESCIARRRRSPFTAAKLVLEPLFEADFEDSAYGYRPARGAIDAVKEVHRLIGRGCTDVVDADLSKYFDPIPHSELMKSVARRIADGAVLRLIKLAQLGHNVIT